MLRLLTGKTGSGKSYQAVSMIFKDLEENKKVFTNIKLNIVNENYHYLDELALKNFLLFIESTFKDVNNLDDKKDEIKETIYFEGNFYIDEAHLVGFRNKTEAILNWFTLQRHFNQNITVITQVASNIHRDYLMMFHTHIDMIPPNKRLSTSSLGYREFEAYKGDRIKTEYFKPDLQIFELYSSGNKETGMSKDVFKVIGVVVFLLFIVAGLFFLKDRLFDNHFSEDKNISITPEISTLNPVPNISQMTAGDDNNSSNTILDSIICSTQEGCYYNARTYSISEFVMLVLSKKKSFKTYTVARSSSNWKLIRYQFPKD